MTDRATHWNRVHDDGAPAERSWYQAEPEVSLRLVDRACGGSPGSVVDVGAGTSVLVDRLVTRGFTDLTVVDVAARALDEVRDRLGPAASTVAFVEADVTRWTPGRTFDVWHDRAVFHFLTDPDDRARYVETVSAAVRAGGTAILAAFAPDGPTQCSGLPVERYGPERFAEVFGDGWSLVGSEREEHVTPSGAVQPFTWVVLRRA